MADLNALIAQGAQFNLPNPVDQYSKVMQLQQMGQANQLNKLKMDEYTRGVDEQNKLRQVMATPGFDVSNPADQAALLQAAPGTAPTLLEKLAQVKKEQAQTGLYGAQGKQINYEVEAKKLAQGLTEISNMPNAAAAKASVDTHIADGSITPEKGAQLKASIDATPDFLKWKTQTLTGMLAAKDRLEAMDEEARIASRMPPAVAPAGPVAAPVAPAAPEAGITKEISPGVRVNSNLSQKDIARVMALGDKGSMSYPGERWTLSPAGNLILEPIPAATAANNLAALGANNLVPPVANVNAMNPNAATMQAINAERTRLEADRNRLLNLKQSKGVQDELKGVEAQLKEINAPINLRAEGTAFIPGRGTLTAAPTMTESQKEQAVLSDPNASVEQKAAATARLAHLSHIPEKAMSDFEKGLAASNLPEAEKSNLRNQWLKTHATHAPPTQISLTQNAEKSYGTAFGGKIADLDVAKYDAASKAPELAVNANRVLTSLNDGNVFVGPAATVKLNLARVLNAAGASNDEKIANTETLISNLGRNTLGMVKSSGLGTGQGFTDKDLQFLEKVAGGSIDYNAQTLRNLAELSHKAASASAESWGKRVKEIPASALSGTGISTEAIVVPPRVTKAAAARPAGVPADWVLHTDAAGKKAYVSPDGKSFKEVP